MDKEIGGACGFFILFGIHYRRMFSDPRMNVLFDTSHSDSNVNARVHGKRVAAWVLDKEYGT